MVKEAHRPSGYLRVEFLNRHPELKDIIDSGVITDYLDDCPIRVVEYKGHLKDETKNQRKNRMKCHKIYDGDIKELVNGLRNTYPTLRDKSGYYLLLEVYEQIRSISELDLELAKRQVEEMNQDNGSTVQESASDSAQQKVEDSSVKISESSNPIPNTDTYTREEVKSKEKEEVKPQNESGVQSSTVTTKVEEPKVTPQLNNGISGESKPEAVLADTPNPTPTTESSVRNKADVTPTPTQIQENKQPIKEEKKMADFENLLGQATQMMETGTKAVNGTGANLPKAEKLGDEAKAAVAKELAQTQAERNAWTAANAVDAVIMAQRPAAHRVKGEAKGRAIKVAAENKDKPNAAVDVVKEKFGKFIEAVAGRKMSIEEFSTSDDAVKYANVVTEGDNVAKAKAMTGVYQNLMQNPLQEIAAYINAEKATAPVKGYVIGTDVYSTDELIQVLVDKGNGVVYGQGTREMDVKEQVRFQLGVAARKQTTVAAASTKSGAPKQLVITAKNKAAFMTDDNHKRYLMTKIDEDGEGTANFKALINVDGKDVNAVCSVYALDDKGERIVTRVDETKGTIYKKKICSINVSVPVQKVIKEVDEAYRNEGDQAATLEARWNIKIPQQETADFANIQDQRSSIAFIALSKLLASGSSAAAMSKSETFRNIAAAVDAVNQKDADAVAADLGL